MNETDVAQAPSSRARYYPNDAAISEIANDNLERRLRVSAPCPILGFAVSFQAAAQLPDEHRLSLWADFLGMIEGRGLRCDQGAAGAMSSHDLIFSIDVGPLIDLASAD